MNSTGQRRNIRLALEYDGTNYHGWQRQQNAPTIQQTVEEAIQRIVQERVVLHGAGRTDAGVHAVGQVANFHSVTTIPSSQIVHAINSELPRDIVVLDAEDVDPDFHAQYSAKSKVYRYTICSRHVRNAIDRHFCHFVKYPLDIDKMRDGARALIGTLDFAAFGCKTDESDNTIRIITRAEFVSENDRHLFFVEANGFLYKMVRGIVGTLLEVGRGKMSLEEMKNVVQSKDRDAAGPSAPPHGLCMIEVKY